MRTPDFSCLEAVLRCEPSGRPTLFEFFLNDELYRKLGGYPDGDGPEVLSDEWRLMTVRAFGAAGYDYATAFALPFHFPQKPVDHAYSRSMNDTAWISDRATFEAYPWPDPDMTDYRMLDTLAAALQPGMKLIPSGPGGVLENVMQLVGYESLCMLIADDPDLVQEIFDAVGSRLVRYYEIVSPHPMVGAVISNDDWGFSTQTMLRPEQMRRYVFPWHKRIVEAIHDAGRPAILHSCGRLDDVMDDIIDDMRYDGKHSYEDKIMPVEDAYERWGRRIAILGGIDVDFVCRRTPDEIRARCLAMLDRSRERGGYALGTGNSVPWYLPAEHYFAMTSAALE